MAAVYLIALFHQILSEYVLIYGLLGAGLYFTLRLGFLQITGFKEMLRCTLGADAADKEGISACISLPL